MKRRVLILYTGGTIGMQASAQGYAPMVGFERLLQEQLRARAMHQLPEYQLLEFDSLIDSANLCPGDWTHIGRRLVERWNDYDGFVVLHGTDTMAYTASALSFMLQGLDKPVIVTGSQIPMSELRNDGLDNLITSLILAGSFDIPEVCIYFNGRLLRGNRCLKAKSAGFDAFDSPNFPWLGQVGIHIDLRQELLLAPGVPCFQVPEFDPEAVVLVQIYPGIHASLVEGLLRSGEVKGVILRSYGVGNPPGGNRDLMRVLERAGERGVVVVNTTQCVQGGVYQGAYASGSTLSRIGVVPGADLTLEAAFTKMHWLIGAGLEAGAIREAIAKPLCGECSG